MKVSMEASISEGQRSGERYALLEDVVDPLELAAQSLAKLKANNLPEVVSELVDISSTTEVQPIDQLNVRVAEPRGFETPQARVVDLSEYKRERQSVRLEWLVKRAKSGDSHAVDRVIEGVNGLAYKIATSYSSTRLSLEDRVQAALRVVPICIERHDVSKGQFTTFVAKRMLGEMMDEARAQSSQASGLPRSTAQKLKPLEGLDVTQRNEMLQQFVEEGFTEAPSLVDPDTGAIFGRGSLDKIQDDESIGYDTIVPPAADNVFNEVASMLEIETIEVAALQLPPRELRVFCHYHGLNGFKELNHREIGEELNFTESRSNQLYAKALENMRVLLGGGSIDRSNRLAKVIDQKARENRRQFIQRLYGELDEVKDEWLLPEEIDTVMAHLSDWHVDETRVGNKQVHLLTLSCETQPTGLSAFGNARRIVGWKDSAITILVEAVHGEDLQILIDIERHLRKLEAESIGYNEQFADQFTEVEQAVLAEIYRPYGQIALERGIAESTVRTHVHNMMRKGEYSTVHGLILDAVRNGMINLDAIPENTTDALTPRTRQIIKDHYSSTYEEVAAELNISVSTVRTQWHEIYKRTGANNERQALLMAVKDGLVSL